MKEFELLISVGYEAGGVARHNCFKEYVVAGSEEEAKRSMIAELKAEGYFAIDIYEVHAC